MRGVVIAFVIVPTMVFHVEKRRRRGLPGGAEKNRIFFGSGPEKTFKTDLLTAEAS